METTIIVISLVVLFVITWIVIACNAPTTDMPPLGWITEKERNIEQIFKLQAENRRLRDELENTCPRKCYRMMRTCGHCEPKIYSCTQSEQKLNDLLKKTAHDLGATSESILKELKR